MIKSVAYPIIYDTGSDSGGRYSVILDGLVIYTGLSNTRYVDIAPLLQNYLNSDRINIDYPSGLGFINSSVQESAGISVLSGGSFGGGGWIKIKNGSNSRIKNASSGGTYIVIKGQYSDDIYVANDYNEDCQSILPDDPYITSTFVRNKVDRRQILFFGANTGLRGLSLDITSTSNGEVVESFSESYSNPSVIVRSMLEDVDFDTTNISFSAGSNGTIYKTITLDVIPCNKWRYALYAVNRRGGVTHLLCEGKPLDSYQKTNNDIETAYNKLSQVGREIRRMAVNSTHHWRLNTGYLTEAESAHINDIITSPRIVLHDLKAGRLYAVNSTDATIENKTRISNSQRLIEYTLNFDEARTYIRK